MALVKNDWWCCSTIYVCLSVVSFTAEFERWFFLEEPSNGGTFFGTRITFVSPSIPRGASSNSITWQNSGQPNTTGPHVGSFLFILWPGIYGYTVAREATIINLRLCTFSYLYFCCVHSGTNIFPFSFCCTRGKRCGSNRAEEWLSCSNSTMAVLVTTILENLANEILSETNISIEFLCIQG